MGKMDSFVSRRKVKEVNFHTMRGKLSKREKK